MTLDPAISPDIDGESRRRTRHLRWRERLAGRSVAELVFVYGVLAIVLVETLYPLVWVLFGSFKTKDEVIANVWGPPSSFIWQNYVEAWRVSGMGDRILNSIIVTGVALVVLLMAATPAAYALSRLTFRGRNLILALIVLAMLVPPQVMAIPLFMTARDLGLINSRLGVALIHAAANLPLSIFILRSFFLSLPIELEDAGRMDGANRLQILWLIMLPLVRPGLALVIIFGFIEIWNDFFLSFLLLREPAVQTIPLGLVAFFQQYGSMWNLYFAALTITTLPVIAVFVLMQRQFIAGLTAGAVKS
ncbi:carbohydrate ABC transporter permease [Rhizobium sp. VS19-DR104.2]|uniref:carbohydrate ABC transporter permease n=1 Tax=unclassified Rhizobium TaxID=2613769 RepID=UPI001ADAAEB0|nr:MULTISPECIES: carbohydrate ABC transporter permease [unclassified Rhizobium]MBO9101159.1 carbohydrate ABC transporter permease [Rhizobium sp. L58/93]MBO9170810.1 carbohydrate ABC transporter permease [Rhizobium sp. L245/93]MBO9186725.1 carbohydrate ABC transporter permease [Rhizobium sp. E27B/91]MBZ5762492.1 carbohydrate ABC transporter permease [Rhizobium sp. VS19-DR96]MBZ5768493.1 carbohydrate ABC transporter permease [Rhizobium sp. VS19-DR129.2]